VQEQNPNSTLNLYRQALKLRSSLVTDEELTWLDSPDQTLCFARPNGWVCFTNFGDEPVQLPDGELLVASAEVVDGKLAGPATAWLKR
jgi:alpha-glucosidase